MNDRRAEEPEDHTPLVYRYSVVPDVDGEVHAVLDGIIRAAFYDRSWSQGLQAICRRPVRPVSILPVRARKCAACERAVQIHPGVLIRRPPPGNPLLKEMEALSPSPAPNPAG